MGVLLTVFSVSFRRYDRAGTSGFDMVIIIIIIDYLIGR